VKILQSILISLIIIFSFSFYGCVTQSPTYSSTGDIVNRYANEYKNISSVDTNTDNHDISAILKTFSVLLIKVPSSTWQDVKNREREYIALISTNSISFNYSIRASSNEINISNGFLNDIIQYYEIIEPNYSYFSGNFISESSVRFIIIMDDYEYEKYKLSK